MIRPWRCWLHTAALVDYADDALQGTRRRRLEAHLRDCSACTRDLAALRSIPPQLQELSPPDRTEEFWRQQQQAIAAAVRQPAKPRRRFAPVAVHWRPAAAAAISLMLALGVHRYSISRKPLTLPSVAVRDVQSLDNSTLDWLGDVMSTLVPPDDYLPHGAVDDAAGLVWTDDDPLRDGADGRIDPQLHSFDTDELEGLAGLVGTS